MKPSGRTRMAPPLGTPASVASKCALEASTIETSLSQRARRWSKRGASPNTIRWWHVPLRRWQAGKRSPGDGPSTSCAGLTDERASRVRNIEHRPSAHDRHVLRRIRRRQDRRTTAVAHRDQFHHKAMDLVRHLEHMVVGGPALDRVAVEQRWLCRAAHDEGELPGDIGRVHERRVDPFPAERTGQVTGIAQQETPPIAQALGGALVHLEVGNPSQIVQADVDADAGIEQCIQFVRLSEARAAYQPRRD